MFDDGDKAIFDVVIGILLELLLVLFKSAFHELAATALHETHRPTLKLLIVQGQIKHLKDDISILGLPELDEFL